MLGRVEDVVKFDGRCIEQLNVRLISTFCQHANGEVPPLTLCDGLLLLLYPAHHTQVHRYIYHGRNGVSARESCSAMRCIRLNCNVAWHAFFAWFHCVLITTTGV